MLSLCRKKMNQKKHHTGKYLYFFYNICHLSITAPADFETAVSATGFGKFNILLLLIVIPSGLATSIESSTMSFVFPTAQCDLDLSLDDKGLLNAITYLGIQYYCEITPLW
jgi:VNT family MFS transporter (synaptic vesicle glycoprotein 2)